MANIKEEFGGITAISCTLASLASSATAGRESASVDNSSNKYLDALVQVKIKTGAGAPANDKAVYIYVAGTADAVTWPDTVTGSDAAITLNNPTQLRLGAVIYVTTAATTYISEPFSVASLFGGVLPPKWSIVIVNFTGQALDASDANMSKQYQGIYQTVV